LSYRYKKEHSVAFKIRQNPSSAGALPRTPLGAHDVPQTPSRLEKGHPSPYSSPVLCTFLDCAIKTDHMRPAFSNGC